MKLIKIILAFVASVLVFFIALSFGTVKIPLAELFSVLLGKSDNNIFTNIIYNIRIPRLLLAYLVGGGLSIVGGVYQSIFKNPLAEPYILGVSSGAAFGAVFAILLGVGFIFVQLFSFLGAVFVIFVVYVLGRRFKMLDPNSMLLTGVMIGAFFGAAILLMLTMLDDSLRTAIFWMIGNLSLASDNAVYYLLPSTVVISLILSFKSYKFNIMSIGDDHAKVLGINIEKERALVYFLTSLLIGGIVAVSGVIGFVGLLVPHLVRLIFGIDNRIVLPVSFFVGASYLIIADTIARSLIPPVEVPVGAVTALVGAPIFIILLRKRLKTQPL